MKGIFLRREWICALLFALSISGSPAQIAPELREDGVLYFDGNLPNKVTLTFRVSTTVYTQRDFQTALAAFYPGDQVELIGMSHEGFLVKGTYRNNTVTGWIHPEDLPSGVDPALFAEAQKNQEHRDSVAVANKTVIEGMTPDEVKQSIGRPDEVSSRSDANGTTFTWVYTTYREDPQYSYALNAFGQMTLQTYYVQVPIGKKTINFVNGVVTSVAEHKTDPNGPGIVTTSP